MSQTFIITNAGRAALVNAANTGTLPVVITQIGVSSAVITPTANLTTLAGEIKRVATYGGQAVADDVIHVSINDEGASAYTLRAFALYLANGVMFGIYGQPTPIAEKTANSTLLMSADIKLADINAASISFGSTEFINPPATETVLGVVELATNPETAAGLDGTRAVHPKGLWFAFSAWVAAQFSDVWKASNDGAGSGLDADLLHGQQGAYYANIPARLGYTPANKAGDTFTGAIKRDAVYYMELSVGNPVLSFDFNDYLVFDRVSNHLHIVTSGLIRATLFPDGGFSTSGNMSAGGHQVWSAGNDGAGSGLDADLLDGLQGSQYARTDVDNSPAYRAKGIGSTDPNIGLGGMWVISSQGANLARNGTYYKLWDAGNDGAGSGLDADLLDGQDSAHYRDIPARLGYTPVRQGGGNGQGNNIVFMGWSGARLKVQVDGLDLGNAVFDANISDVWRSSNDGSGSGLDADRLDGLESSQFVRVDGTINPARSQGVMLAGNEVNENFSSAPIQIREVNYVGNSQSSSAHAPSLSFHWSGLAAAAIKMYSDGSLRCRNNSFDPNGLVPLHAHDFFARGNPAWHAGNDGGGSGLDADLLDGQDSGFYTNIPARLGYQPADINDTWKPSNDGSGSGLDADTVDGRHASDFILSNLFDWNLTTQGHYTLPGGLTICWGTSPVLGNDADHTIGLSRPLSVLLAAVAVGNVTNRFHDNWGNIVNPPIGGACNGIIVSRGYASGAGGNGTVTIIALGIAA